MVSRMSVPICNLVRTIRANSGKITLFHALIGGMIVLIKAINRHTAVDTTQNILTTKTENSHCTIHGT